MNRPLRPLDDDSDRDKPRNKRRYDDKEKRPGLPEREADRGVTRSRTKDAEDWEDEDWEDKDLGDLDEDIDLTEDDEDWDGLEEDEKDWAEPGFEDDDDR
jgi:hypothetical protein